MDDLRDFVDLVRRNFKDLFRRIAQLEMAGGKDAPSGGGGGGFSGSHQDLTDVFPDDHHDPVTLGSMTMANVVNLNEQELDLDSQTANRVFAGPPSGAAAQPTFRALVQNDIPALDYLTTVGEGPGINVVGNATVGLEGDTILLYDAGGQPVAEFAATGVGLASALVAAGVGDVVWLPAGTISGGPWTVSAGTLRGLARSASVLDGLVIVAGGARVEQLTVARDEDDVDPVVGIQLSAGAIADGCVLKIANATGDVRAIDARDEGACYVRRCLFDLSAGGAAYGAFADGAEIYVEHSAFVPDTIYIPVGVA